ncbi:hypothetical protein [Flavobacterium wongokense]|uniref:hypothetical protein n=1 Tax=Flavobacterium wongokense TaxID=2910674 RepID=UPI001F213817|nr:hypothetical protein [Flavobacterium sp. WG47]MCF6132347.1 hypothetical protein [Flavobacterium sp. WG47]
MKNNYIILCFAFLLTSCSIKGRFYGLYGYYKKAQSENPDLYKKVDETSKITNFNNEIFKDKVIVTNGKMVRKNLGYNEYSVVYIWSPKCHSSICIPPDLVQSKCNLKNLELYVVSEYYSNEEMSEKYNLANNIIGVDTEYYKSSLTKKYLSRFLFDLTGKKEIDRQYLFFKKGIYQASYTTLEEIQLQ